MSNYTNTTIPQLLSIRRPLSLGVCAVALLTCHAAVAAESSIEFGLSGEASYDDNRYLSSTNKQDVYIFRINPSVGILMEDEGSETLFSVFGSYALSSDQLVQEDRFNYGGSVTGNYQFEYSSLSLAAGYNHDSVLDTEFEDTGIFSNNATRDSGNASFGYETSLSETWSLRVSDNFQVMDYSSLVFNNFWSNRAGMGVDVLINERTALVQDFSYLRYEPENVLAPTRNSYSYLAGLRHDLSENTRMTVTGGVSYLDDVYRWSAVAELVHELENNQLSVRAAREIQPSGLGGLKQDESISFDTTYNYSLSTNMGLTASWRRNKSLDNFIAFDNEFIGFSPWVSFEVMRDLNVRLRYHLRRQKIGITNDWGISNSFYISIEY